MALIKVILCGFVSSIMILKFNFYFLFSFFLNFYIVRCLRESYTLYWNSKITLTTNKKSSVHLLAEFSFCVFLILVYCAYFMYLIIDHNNMVTANLQWFVITICISSGVLCLKKLTVIETSYINAINNLTSGYGGAIWYYKNYLKRILPAKFVASVKKFENKESVELPHKLYILCPKSCKVQQNIDNTDNIDNIEGSKDLPSVKIDHGGVKDREYRVSVYRIKSNGEYFRCALEYAQPLKTLLTLKENGVISLTEMYAERDTFIKNLSEMLMDRVNSFQFCELVEYDDAIDEIHVVLASLASIQKYKCKTKE